MTAHDDETDTLEPAADVDAAPVGGAAPGKWANDHVEAFTPPSFALAFVRALRRHKGASHKPSLRTTLAIPKLLTARYFRKRELTPRDYLEAAVLNTPAEDQALAEEIARELLFPRADKPKEGGKKAKAKEDAQAAAPAAPEDPTAAILGDLASLNIDLDNLDALSLDLFEEPDLEEEDREETAFDLFERLYSSAFEHERALAELVFLFGGPAELEAIGASTVPRVEGFVKELLLEKAGELSPAHLVHGCKAGFGDDLARAVQQPWELAAVFAGTARDAELDAHLMDLSLGADARVLGKTLQFLKSHLADRPSALEPRFERFLEASRARAKDLSDFAELLHGLEEWSDPPEALLERSATESLPRALTAARFLNERFGTDLGPTLFERWASSLEEEPSLAELAEVAVDCSRFEALANRAFEREIAEMIADAPSSSATTIPFEGLAPKLREAVPLAALLQRAPVRAAKELARRLCTEALCAVPVADAFLPLLDAYLEHPVVPGDLERVIQAGQALGVDPNEIYDRIGDAVEQLRQMILGDVSNPERYQLLCSKVHHVPQELLEEMVSAAVGNGNLESMAALLAVDMGGTSALAPDDMVLDGLGYKGIGGGSNLLTQWFTHRKGIKDSIRARIKETAKAALLDVAFEWLNKGAGSEEAGLIPQNRARPFTASDDLDLLDIEGSLDAVISAGKALQDISIEDLVVHDTSKGRAAFVVLIDISGSMSGGELAACAISVVMLLGRLRPEEIALAVFESDTHVIKGFHDLHDLDDVADEVLDLEATGGTRVDAALRWAGDELEGVPEAEHRMLFLLSDFYFFEKQSELSPHATRLADQRAILLAAHHAQVDSRTRDFLVEVIGGQSVSLKDLKRLPEILLETLRAIGDGALSR